MKKWCIIGGSLLGLLVALMVGLLVAYNAVLSKDFLVAKIEESIDSRVQIGDFRVSLFSVPAKVVIEDVLIAEPDELVRDGVAHDERPPLDGGVIEVKEIAFDVSLGELLSREIKVSKLQVKGAHFDMALNEAGDLDIEKRFAAPGGKQKDKAPAAEGNDKGASGFATQLDRLLIDDSSFSLLIEKTGLEVTGKDLRFDLKDIRVDPGALEKVNEAQLEFEAHLEAFSAKKGRQKYGQLGLEGPARVRLYDPATGKLDPDAEIEFAIRPDSYVSSQAPYIVKLWSVTDTLHKFGLNIQPLSSRLTFGRDRVIDGSYRRNRIDLHEPVALVMDDWELALKGESWIELGTEQHRSNVQLIAGSKVSRWMEERLQKITGVAPKEVRARLYQDFMKQLFVGERLALDASTQESLSDPKVRLETRLPDAKEIAKDYAKEKALDLLFDALK